MVKIMENPIKMDDLGVSLFSETLISSSKGTVSKSRVSFHFKSYFLVLYVAPNGDFPGNHFNNSFTLMGLLLLAPQNNPSVL